MVINAPPAAGGTGCDADIGRLIGKGAIADRTVLGLGDIAGLGALYDASCVLVLNPAQKPVGNGDSLRVLSGGRCRIGVRG